LFLEHGSAVVNFPSKTLSAFNRCVVYSIQMLRNVIVIDVYDRKWHSTKIDYGMCIETKFVGGGDIYQSLKLRTCNVL